MELTEIQRQYLLYLGGTLDDGRTLLDGVVADLALKGLLVIDDDGGLNLTDRGRDYYSKLVFERYASGCDPCVRSSADSKT